VLERLAVVAVPPPDLLGLWRKLASGKWGRRAAGSTNANVAIGAGSLRFDVGGPDHLSPFLGFCRDEAWREEALVVLAPAITKVRNPHKLLASEPFIRMERKSWAGRLVDGYLQHVGIRPLERFEIYTQEAIAGMVDRGLGVSLVPDWAPPWPSGLSLRKISVPPNPFARRVGLIWTKASVRSRLVRVVLEVAVLAPTLRQKSP
jgi:DNA-binding transcriptional LysR family regulator